MVYNYSEAGRGLKIVVYSVLIAIAAAVVSIIPLLGILGPLLGIAAPIVAAYGFSIAAKGHPDYTVAMYLAILDILLGVALVVVGNIIIIGALVSVASAVCSALVVHTACTATMSLLDACGRPVTPNGKFVWQGYIVATLISVGYYFLRGIPVIGWLVWILGIPVALITGLAAILYYVFLWRAQRALS